MVNIKIGRKPTKMKNACPFYNVFHVLKVLLLKLIQPPDLSVLAVFISPYISRYHFHIFLELHPILSDKIIFLTNFHFLMDSLNPSHPLNSQNLLRVTKVFFLCSLKSSHIQKHCLDFGVRAMHHLA